MDVRPQDQHGHLDLETLLGTPQDSTLVYCCGPEPLLEAVEKHCVEWPAGSLHIEQFAPKPQDLATQCDMGFDAVTACSRPRSGQPTTP